MHPRSPSEWRSADPPTRPVLFVNPRSGGGFVQAAVAARARALGIAVEPLDGGRSLADLVEAAIARGADALGVAGGDGSLAVVAAAAHAHDLPFVCVPAGTRNHFASDAGVDRRDPAAALDAFAQGVERRIDLARVNGRIFLNNVSLGIYGDAVSHPGYREAKARTLLETAQEVLGPSGAASDLRVVDDDGHEHRSPAVVLVSNNPYALEPPQAGRRPALDTGRLGVLVLLPPRARVPARTWTAAELEVDAPATVHAGIDGEAVDLDPPLAFASIPAALRLRVAAAAVEAS